MHTPLFVKSSFFFLFLFVPADLVMCLSVWSDQTDCWRNILLLPEETLGLPLGTKVPKHFSGTNDEIMRCLGLRLLRRHHRGLREFVLRRVARNAFALCQAMSNVKVNPPKRRQAAPTVKPHSRAPAVTLVQAQCWLSGGSAHLHFFFSSPPPTFFFPGSSFG